MLEESKKIDKLGKSLGNIEEYESKSGKHVEIRKLRRTGNKHIVITPTTDVVEKNIKNARSSANRWMERNDSC